MKRSIFAALLCAATCATQAQYAGLVISEVITNPTDDEMIEITNTTGTAIDISGVIVSDEESARGEGAVSFPASTSLAAGATVVVAVGGARPIPHGSTRSRWESGSLTIRGASQPAGLPHTETRSR
ncbi:hypothetical protein BH09SUM1_BH09SUM1_31480 [soil metagenome]